MKAVIISNKPSVFEPIKIELVIETESDLYNLLIRLNESPVDLNRRNDCAGDFRDYPEHVVADSSLTNLWNQLDDIAEERGLIPKNS